MYGIHINQYTKRINKKEIKGCYQIINIILLETIQFALKICEV